MIESGAGVRVCELPFSFLSAACVFIAADFPIGVRNQLTTETKQEALGKAGELWGGSGERWEAAAWLAGWVAGFRLSDTVSRTYAFLIKFLRANDDSELL